MSITNRHTIDYIRSIRRVGRYTFTLEDLEQDLSKHKRNIQKDIDRLREKGEVINIRRGFYIIVPDEYRNMGTLPTELYIDDLMKYLDCRYYIGLYSAAMFHGAAHQQPQEFYVINESPSIRNIKKENLSINFSEKKNFPNGDIEQRKTDTGYINVSSKALTFMDIIYFEKSLGSYSRIITILEELVDELSSNKLLKALENNFPQTVLQRSGYIIEKVLQREDLAIKILNKLKNKSIRKTLLVPSGKKIGEIDKKWNVQVNTHIESDL